MHKRQLLITWLNSKSMQSRSPCGRTAALCLAQQQHAAEMRCAQLESPAFLLLLTNNASPTVAVVQGAENFAREFKQLRRSFRFNEYKSISEVNPPNNPIEKVTHV